MGHKHQFVTIKGTKDGLTLHLDDRCSFQELLTEIEEKLSVNHETLPDTSAIVVNVRVGTRYITKVQEETLRSLIRQKKSLIVGTIDSEVMTKTEALEWKKQTGITTIWKIVRSGQVIKVPGDLLLIGDVNPGGSVIAAGNIFVMGALKGQAHAGSDGKKDAVIVASTMRPSQLKICDIMNRAPDRFEEVKHEMECAYINEFEQIMIDRLKVLSYIRPDLSLTTLERGV